MFIPNNYGPIWYMILNTCFLFLNNIAHISKHFSPICISKKTENCFKHIY